MKATPRERRRRLLISAFSTDPERGSEAGVGWRRALHAAKEFDTWVLCGKEEYEAPIRRWLKSNGPIKGLTFLFVPMTPVEIHLWNLRSEFSYMLRYVVYNRWQRRAYRMAAQLHRENPFDLVHHVTWCGFREPGYLWRLGAPFIWGPVGGTQNYPWRFLSSAGVAGAMYEGVRTVLNNLQLRYSPRVRRAAKRSALILAANSRGAVDLSQCLKVQVRRLPDVGVDHLIPDVDRPSMSNRPLRILWSGRFEHRKALHLLLLALGGLTPTVPYQLKILGDGPLRERWHRIALRSGVTEHSQWCGKIPLEEALEQYRWADVFVFTSLRDTFGTVVLEALSRGVPVICFDHYGAGDAVTESCGIKIPVTTPSLAIQSLRKAITWFAENPHRWQSLRNGAIERAGQYLWESQAKNMMAYYHAVVASAQRNSSLTELTAND